MSDQQESSPEQQPQPAVQDNTASLEKRFLAFLIDMMAMAFCVTPLIEYFDLIHVVETTKEIPLDIAIKITAYQFTMFFVLHGFLLHRYGQTIGKRLMKIAIVDLHNQKLGFVFLIVNRYLPQWVAGFVPGIGVVLRFVDVIFIYRDNTKRCVHDLIAGTKVIDLRLPAPPSPPSASKDFFA